MKFSTVLRRGFRWTIYLVALLLVLLAIDLVLLEMRRTIHRGFDTTRIMTPVTSDGLVDYRAALEEEFSRGITDDNNAFPLLLEAFGRQALSRDPSEDYVTHRLHMSPLPEQGPYLQLMSDFDKPLRDAGSNEKTAVDETRWPPDSKGRFVEWLKLNEKPLAKVREASLRPRYFVPLSGHGFLYSVLLPHIHPMQSAVQGFVGRALLRAESGDLNGAADDLGTAHRLTHLCSTAPSLVERMTSAELERMTCRAERTIAQHAKLDAASARTFLNQSLSVSELPTLARNLDVGERYFVLDFCQRCAHEGPVETRRRYLDVTYNGQQHGYVAEQLFRLAPIPFEASMQMSNSMSDALVTASAKPRYADRAAAFKAINELMDERSRGILRLTTSHWAAFFVPVLNLATENLALATTELHLMQICWALAAYHADHGSYPESLQLLKSQYMPTIPEDLFADGPFQYRRQGDGYQLYSVGPNMRDELDSAASPADDIDASLK